VRIIVSIVFSLLLLATFATFIFSQGYDIVPVALASSTTLPALPASTNIVTSEPSSTTALRSLAQSNGLSIGTAVAVGPLRSDPVYSATVAREFNILTPENAMKFKLIHPDRNTYDFADSDFIVDFAEKNNIDVHGHTLVWHNNLPTWLTQQTWSREELITILHEHIMTVVGRYKGRVREWDVVNEAVADNGLLRETIWMKGIGPEYIEMAFRWAHEADPDALLFYNDYGAEGKGKKSDAVFALVRSLVKKGVPVNSVGLQMHVRVETCPAPQDVEWNINRLAALGLDACITEMDVRFKSPSTEIKSAEAAQIYRNMLETFLSAKSGKTFIVWGFTDNHSWISSAFPGWEPGLIFSSSYQPQPAYTSLTDCLCD
jgi:endo-1,4-beta-xylanase